MLIANWYLTNGIQGHVAEIASGHLFCKKNVTKNLRGELCDINQSDKKAYGENASGSDPRSFSDVISTSSNCMNMSYKKG